MGSSVPESGLSLAMLLELGWALMLELLLVANLGAVSVLVLLAPVSGLQ
jgi:hypothetical protein